MPIPKSLWIRRPLLSGLGLAAALLLASSAHAQEPVRDPQADEPPPEADESGSDGPGSGIEEIVVRGAESEAVQDFKIADSVTAFSAADLVALGAANIADLAAFTPNLEIVTAGATTPTFFIRGVGLNDFNANSTGAVSVYQNDVPVNAPALQLGTLFDVENVSILRGPQGTGLARNSSAGAIKTYARKPTGQLGGFLRAEAGNYNFQKYEGAVESPIFEDMLSGRFAFLVEKRDGTMENRCGDAIANELRQPLPPLVAPPGQPSLRSLRKTPNDAPYSICGETVTNGFISPVPPGLAEDVNDRNNWAARGTLLFEPTLETSFLLGAHGTVRDELSRLGQSYGTLGTYCLDGNFANCGGPGGLFQNGGSRITNLLGGTQGTFGGSYQPIEVKADWTHQAPCYDFGFTFVSATSQCGTQPTSPTFQQFDNAKRATARELARNLDDEPWKGDFNKTDKTVNHTWGMSVRGEYLLPFDLDLSTASGYDRYYRRIGIDLDFSPETLFQIYTEDDGWQFYQDVKLAGEYEFVPGTPFRWDIGAWVLPEKLEVFVNNDIGALTALSVCCREYEQRLLSTAGYGSFAFDFWDDFTLDGGVRYNWERKKIDYVLGELGGSFQTQLEEYDIWQAPTGTIRLTYRFREDAHAYWKYNRGWKPGHYNATGSRVQGITIADPEFIDAFETGLRAEWFGGVVGAEASLFYYNYKDYQIFTAQQFAGSSPEFVVINANDAEVYGAEIDALVRPWDGAFVNVRFGWLETQFLDFVQVQQAVITRNNAQVIINRELQNSGNPLLNSPRFKVSITAEQTIPLGKYGYLVPRYDGAWTDTTYYDATKGRGLPNSQGINPLPKYSIAQRPYWLHNARVAYRTPDGRVEIAGWVRNIENKAYKTYAFDGSTFQATSIYFVGDPRTYGGTITVTF
jgi:outer membrane receptor protein involved in Fe transport